MRRLSHAQCRLARRHSRKNAAAWACLYIGILAALFSSPHRHPAARTAHGGHREPCQIKYRTQSRLCQGAVTPFCSLLSLVNIRTSPRFRALVPAETPKKSRIRSPKRFRSSQWPPERRQLFSRRDRWPVRAGEKSPCLLCGFSVSVRRRRRLGSRPSAGRRRSPPSLCR